MKKIFVIIMVCAILNGLTAYSLAPSTTVDLDVYSGNTINLFVGDEVHASDVLSESSCDEPACDGILTSGTLVVPTSQQDSNCECTILDTVSIPHTITMNIQTETNGSLTSPSSDISLIAFDSDEDERGVLI